MSHKHELRREAAHAAMATESKRLIRLQATPRLIALGSRAIYITSLKHGRFVSFRIALVYGLEKLKNDRELRLIAHLKHFKKHELHGLLRVHVALDGDECLLLETVKGLLQVQSSSPVTTSDALCVALIAANASESAEVFNS